MAASDALKLSDIRFWYLFKPFISI